MYDCFRLNDNPLPHNCFLPDWSVIFELDAALPQDFRGYPTKMLLYGSAIPPDFVMVRIVKPAGTSDLNETGGDIDDYDDDEDDDEDLAAFTQAVCHPALTALPQPVQHPAPGESDNPIVPDGEDMMAGGSTLSPHAALHGPTMEIIAPTVTPTVPNMATSAIPLGTAHCTTPGLYGAMPPPNGTQHWNPPGQPVVTPGTSGRL
jgi:hypothetical protein